MKLPKLASHTVWSAYNKVLLFFSLSTILLPSIPAACALTNETDRLALLKFKESIVDDPHGILSSWNDSTHFCYWVGVTCGRRHQRVTVLHLEDYELHGTISPYIGNLSFLRLIILHNNSLFGQIPKDIGHLFRLRELLLQSNKMTGELPPSLANCSRLRNIYMENNHFTGLIPVELASIMELETLALGRNYLTGGLPPALGNISTLKFFAAESNNLEGTIPDDIGRLKKLSQFIIGGNKLSGTNPSALFNISSLILFIVSDNQLNGTLPDYIGATLSNLRKFELGDNELSGPIPISIFNGSGLQVFDIFNNNFVGPVPTNLGALQELWYLGLSYNNLGRNSVDDLNFLTSLINCSKLQHLGINGINAGGILPQTIGNLSTQLIGLYIGFNQISGNIPTEIANLINLTSLVLHYNLLTGSIPTSFGKFRMMQVMSLHSNRFSGQIPSSIGNLTQLIQLYLNNNTLQGSIPASLGNCQNLQDLDFSQNNLTGAIPEQFIDLSSISLRLVLSQNSLTGHLPPEVGKLKNTNLLDLSENDLSGEIPVTIGDCSSLVYLYLEGNFFQGGIPTSLASLRGLQVLDLSRNKLTGKIPQDLQNLPDYVYLNFSFNSLEGEVPTGGVFKNASSISVTGNKLLCGGVKELQLPPCPVQRKNHRLELIIIIVCVVLFIFLLATCFTIYWMTKSKKLAPYSPSVFEYHSKVSYRSLHQATGGFSPRNLIGSGSFGSVYKGNFDSEERAIAVKVLNLQKKGSSKSFITECNILSRIRHRNLLKILTCCSSTDNKGNDFKAIVFEFMVNGSLEKWLHPEHGELQSLNLLERINIAIDVASALYYLHYECEQPIIHSDLKPSNILLNSDMVACVSDFGLARILFATNQLSQNQTSTIGLKGTVGYAALEYGIGGEASKQGDVYSFGILMLEMFTGKRPTHEMFKDGFNLHNYVKYGLPPKLVEIVDPTLLQTEAEDSYNNHFIEEIKEEKRNTSMNHSDNQINGKTHKCLKSILEVGLACSMESPRERIDIRDVTRLLHLIKAEFLGVHNLRDSVTAPTSTS